MPRETGQVVEELPLELNEVVTIGLYCIEKNAESFNINEQIKQIEHIRKKIMEAAKQVGKKTPKFVLSVLLIPNWEKKDNSYNNEIYKKICSDFFEKLKKQMKELNCEFELQNAYQDTSKEEQEYLHQLRNNGANADWIKTHALISNPYAKHLQLDSNTQIINYNNFYAHTFGQDVQDALVVDGLNASAYDANSAYVSPHNKVVYTVPSGKIVKAITEPFLKYCAAHKDPHDQDKDKNSIYSKVFCSSLATIGLTTRKEVIVAKEGVKDRYLVNFNNPEYKLTQDIITAVNMSWATSSDSDPYVEIKRVQALKYLDAEITFPCFINLVNVHGALFEWHDDRELLEKFRNELHNREQDIGIICAYYTYIKEEHSDLLPTLVDTIPHTKYGEQLCMDAFRCNINDLRNQALQDIKNKTKRELDDLQTRPKMPSVTEKSELLAKLRKIEQQLSSVQPATMQPAVLNSLLGLNYIIPTEEQILQMSKEELEQHKKIINDKIYPVGKPNPQPPERATYHKILGKINHQLSVLDTQKPEKPKLI